MSKKTDWHVEVAMRYEEPSIESALKNLESKGFNRIFVVALYPHNAMSTTITTQVEVDRIAKDIIPNAEFVHIKPFYNLSLIHI